MAGNDEVVPQEAELTLEQQQAVALANARRRMQEKRAAEESGYGRAAGRALGLTARAGAIPAAGALAGAAMGAPLAGVGAVPGAAFGALAATIIGMGDKLAGTNYLDRVLTKIGLPEAETEEEKLGLAGAEAMASGGGITGVAKAIASRAAPRALPQAGATRQLGPTVSEALADAPGLTAAGAAGGGVAQEAAAQAEGGPTEQFLANLAGSALTPVGAAAVKGAAGMAGKTAGEVISTVRAAMGHKPSVEKLTRDATQRLVEEDAPAIKTMMDEAETYVPGATPTAAEAVAQGNLKDPTRQVGGSVVKMQEELSGAKGIEDVLPTKMRQNQAALDKHMEDLRARTSMLRDRAFENARMGPAGPGLVVGKGPVQGADPLYVSRVAQHALQDRTIGGYGQARALITKVLNDLRTFPKNQHGRMDPEVMYGIREGAAKHLRQLAKEGATPADAVSMKALRQLQNAMDDAIERGGAVGWKEYLRIHSAGMKPVDKHMARLKEAASIAEGVSARSPQGMVAEELPQIPHLLSRPTLFINFVLKLVAKDATTPVMKEMATRMQDPKQFAALLARPEAAPAKKAMYDTMMQAAVLSNLIQKHQGEQREE